MSTDSPGTGPQVLLGLEQILIERSMTLTELSHRTGITMANLSILKNNKARAIRLSTLATLCETLGVLPGDLLLFQPSARPLEAGRDDAPTPR
ncbi:helix-turn-helix transcriptional regulator [Isoptericola sp. b490]|uniref:helix-turn-helix domain-containing protein n=1 Tax=Actinotalea lenta TaxID=3064654 RepID=UPI002713FA00|nr:helix-turn-helix transcriptional regulator [Isoptericola sp. b490]MDO8122073.1 helix-turn-helix transcriptional regulator [Isoptericola sp. b490]